MADLEPLFTDQMFYDKNIYRPEVRLDEDGFYRWGCILDKYHNRKMYGFLIKFWAVFALCGLVMGYLLAQGPIEVLRVDRSRYQAILTQRRIFYAIAGYAAFFAVGLLITGLVRLIEGGPSRYWYRMNGEFVQIKPSGKSSGVNLFKEVKRVELSPNVNEIRLISAWGRCPVLVRAEDYALVKDHILTHIPETAKVSEQKARN